MPMRASPIDGWPLLGLFAAGLGMMSVGLLVGADDPVRAERDLIRATGRTSLILFCLGFAASGLRRLRPSPPTAWLKRNRRQVGLAFALSHAIHAAALAALATTAPALFAELTGTATLVLGGAGYLVLAAMAATSFDRTAAMIGAATWSRLHRFGSWVLWLSFVGIYAGRLAADLAYWPAVALLACVMLLRLRS